MKTVIANRDDFFLPGRCPIALRSIMGEAPCQHDGDLTDIRHSHNFAELVVITQGHGRHWINGDIYEVSGGDVFLIQGNVEHYFEERHNIGMFNIMFDDHYLRELLKDLRSLPGFNAFFLFEPLYRRRHKFQSRLRIAPDELWWLTKQLRQMQEEMAHTAPGFDLVMLAKVLKIFVFISREYSRTKEPKAESLNRLGELLTELENDYDQKWTITRISKIAAMAPSTLLPIFKAVTGHSPIDYLLHVRLAKAAKKLVSSDASVTRIAEECGFLDSNYFSRQFKKKYNCSPRQYRDTYA